MEGTPSAYVMVVSPLLLPESTLPLLPPIDNDQKPTVASQVSGFDHTGFSIQTIFDHLTCFPHKSRGHSSTASLLSAES